MNYNKISFKERIFRFFYGRNGTDQLAVAVLVLYFVLSLTNIFVGSFVLQLFCYALLLYSLFRTMSRNIYKRRAENLKFCSLLARIKRFFSVKKRSFKERKFKIYKKCPFCKSTLRLPKKKGRHNVNCPKCNKLFEVKI